MASTAGFRAKILENGINNQDYVLQAIDDAGNNEDSAGVQVSLETGATLTDDEITRVQINSSITLTISSGTTIAKIRLKDSDNYDPDGADLEAYIEEDIGGSGGEDFPDGGEIEVTDFKFRLDDE